ncbi:DUF2784 domain-containing protein [Pilimelia columellifera]|uniref:DUF2784 domain-containing protein n=1 Tax=Pilimelia columellifera subsp. columellifera TaxID=706583 RepID=A0ABN3NAD8_9ACTN
MVYRLLADAAMTAHFGFLAYVTVGGFLTWRWPRLFWPHLAAAAWALGIVLVGWDCPLTRLENWARARGGEAALPPGGFIDHYIEGVVYPRRHAAAAQLAVGVLVVGSWAGLAWRRRRATRTRP